MKKLMDISEFKGLSNDEVAQKKKLGLANQTIDSYSPSYPQIVLGNIFNLINIVLFPLLVALGAFGLYQEILVFSVFLVINTIVSMLDQIRVKQSLDKLKAQFQLKSFVIREGIKIEIPISDIVVGDLIYVSSGESVVADGKILKENYLQLDESSLTGEANYLRKEVEEELKAGSFVVTGECIYIAENIGKSNYLNKLGSETLKFKERKSKLQKASNFLIFLLVFLTIATAAINFLAMDINTYSREQQILSITTIVALVIPQTLIFLYTLTFTISITKLFRKGVLVQKGGSIEDLANIDTICFDKTGTITTNEMKIVDAQFWGIEEAEISKKYSTVMPNLVSVNKTQSLLNERYRSSVGSSELQNFFQIPFTSKIKFSLSQGVVDSEPFTLIFGAWSVIASAVSEDLVSKINTFMSTNEENGMRILIGLYFKEIIAVPEDYADFASLSIQSKTNQAFGFVIEEELNYGIIDVFDNLTNQNIDIKIISGDSKASVEKILGKVGFKNKKIADLSVENISDMDMNEVSIFTRAKPEDKLAIVKRLRDQGKNVAMVGDGINDVLGLKVANVSISMESGAKIARDVADIVLLKNDFSKVPFIFFEGENIIYNLSLSTKLFLVKCFYGIMMGLVFALISAPVPIFPNSTLIFSFIGSSAPGYLIVFTRQKVKKTKGFFRDILTEAIPASIFFMFVIMMVYYFAKNTLNYSEIEVNSLLVIIILSISTLYSIHLVAKSGKISKLSTALVFFTLSMIVGLYQTILPIAYGDWSTEKSLILLSMALIAIPLIWVFVKSWKPFRLYKVAAAVLLAIAALAAASSFPFQDWYRVVRVEWLWYAGVVVFGFVFVMLRFGLMPRKPAS